MDIKQDQAIKRLLKKLSALRATLNNDERRMLDGLVTGTVNEVEAHKMPKQALKQALKGADEVEAHQMPKQALKQALKGADEVEAHQMPKQALKQALKGADEVEAHSMGEGKPPLEQFRPQVIFDPIKDEYHQK